MNAHAYEMPTWLIIVVCTVIYHPSSLGHPCLLLFLLQLSEDNLAVVTQLCSRLCWLGESDVIDWGLCCRQTWRENHWCLSCWRPSTQTHVFQDVVVTTMLQTSYLLKESDWADAVFFLFFFWTNCSTFVRISTWHLFFIKSAMCCGLLPEMDLFSLLGTVVHALSLFTAADVKSNQLNYMWLSGSGCIQHRTNRHPTYHLLHNNDDIDMKEQCLWSQWGFDLHLVTMLMKWSLVK